MTTKDFWWGIVTLIILLALILFAGYALRTNKSLEGAAVVIGVLITKLGTLIDFRYGSSKGSKEKTELLTQKEAGNENV